MLTATLRAAAVAFLVGLAPVTWAQANLSGIVINEILVDPNSATLNYDTDGDGTAEDNDEFIELYNSGSSAVDISSWRIYDNSTTTPLRHTFAAGTVLQPGAYIVVVGAYTGTPPVNVVVANGNGSSSPTLGISNGGDEIFLYNPTTNEYIGAFVGSGSATGQIAFTGPAGSTNRGEDSFGLQTAGQSVQRNPSGSTAITSGTPTPAATFATGSEGGPKSGLSMAVANPLRDGGVVRYALDAPAEATLALYDVLGRRVAVLADGLASGEQTAALSTAGLAPGAYVLRLQVGGRALTRTVSVVR